MKRIGFKSGRVQMVKDWKGSRKVRWGGRVCFRGGGLVCGKHWRAGRNGKAVGDQGVQERESKIEETYEEDGREYWSVRDSVGGQGTSCYRCRGDDWGQSKIEEGGR